MEFRFDLKSLFNQPIVKVDGYLVPKNFRGDRRTTLEATTKMSEIIDTIGEISAKAQGLVRSVTTSQKLRSTDGQSIYLLVNTEYGKRGAIIGFLKIGKKSLYVFNETGKTVQVDACCILDFFIHESHQRTGLGRKLFDAVLAEENWEPVKLAIDRPSDKLLAFLHKHYGLHKIIPQANNFVLYQGFFDEPNTANNNQESNGIHITTSPNTALFGPNFVGGDHKKRIKQQASSSITVVHNSPLGRYAAPRPTCSMAEIIHSTATPVTGEPNRIS